MQRMWIAIAGLAIFPAFVIAPARPGSADAADASRPSGKIAFVRGADLFVMNADGSGQRQLTSGPSYDVQPDWSPDGRTIVYTREYPPFVRRSDIFALSASGGGQRRLTNGPGRALEPAWSPGGRTIAMIRDGDLCLMKPDGTQPRRLTRLKSVGGPAWSPDGRQIAFALWRYPGGIWVINADGSGLRRLELRVGRVAVGAPAWSPNGDKIAFSTGAVDGAIYVISLDGSDHARLTRRARTVSGIGWSRDGRKIVYERAGGGGIYTINIDGTGERRLALATGSEFGEFSLSLDERAIAYASSGDIYVMNADGSGRRQLTDTPEVDGAPIWSPKRARR